MPVGTADVTGFARALKALSDPVRLRMVGVLAEGRESCELPDLCTRNVPGEGTPAGLCVCELQEQFGLSQSRTSYHLRILREAGLVTEEVRGKWTFYELDREAVATTLRALQDLTGA
jgi:ArsR family transcriptional regulator, arsenate/arsenite/antimonite-responsive transcriptional repressor